MERIRESRRGTPSSSSGGVFPSSSSRRRSRGTVFRESSGVSQAEDGGNDSTRKREHPSSGRMRRRPGSSENFRVDNQDEGRDGSSDESMGEELEEDDEPVVQGAGRSKPQWKGSEEIIGVSVPRKARSASAKRLQDSVLALWPSSSSSPLRNNVVLGSSPSSNSSIKAGKKVASISESEVEVAQFLYGLTRLQSHQSPAKSDVLQSSVQPDFRSSSSNQRSSSTLPRASSSASAHVSLPPSSQSMGLPQHSSTASTTAMVPKRKKPRHIQSEDSGSLLMTTCNSKSSASSIVENSIGSIPNSSQVGVVVEKKLQATNAEISPPKPDNNVAPCYSRSSKPKTSLSLTSSPQTATPIHLQQEDKPIPSSPAQPGPLIPEIDQRPSTVSEKVEAETSDSIGQAPGYQANQASLKESSSSMPTLPALSTPDVKPNALDNASPISTAAKSVKGTKIKIDLMALPENIYPDDDMPDVSDKSILQSLDTDETICKEKSIADFAVKVEVQHHKLKQDPDIHDLEKKIPAKIGAESATIEKQSAAESKSGFQHNENDLEKVSSKLQLQKNQKGSARQEERTGPSVGIITSTATPVHVTFPGWPGGLSPIGYLGSSPANLSGVPSIQGAVPPNAPFITLPPARLGHYATHCYIARLIQYQQQLAKFNPFWHAASAAALYGTKPYNLNILPQSNALLFGGSVVRNPTLPSNGSTGSGSMVALNGYSLKDKVPNYFTNAKQPLLPQQVQQQGAAFISPAPQPRMGGTKPSGSSESTHLLSSLGAVAASDSSNTNFSSLAATSDKKYLAMHPGNYHFPMPPAYQAHMAQQQQHLPPLFNGSFYPSQLLQIQSQSLQQTHNPVNSAGSSSSQNHLQVQHCFPTSKPPAESCHNEPEHAGKSEDTVHSQVPLSQKKVQNYSLSGNASFPPNFAIMVGKQQQPSDPCLRISSKGTDVTVPVPLGQDMGNHQRYQLTDSEDQQKASARAPLKSSEKPQVPPQLPKQAMSRTKSPVPAISTPSSVAGSTAYADRVPVVYSNNSGHTSLPNMQSSQRNMLSSQKAKSSSLPVNPVNKKAAPPSTVFNQPTQAQSLTRTQHLIFSSSEPKNQTSAVQVMFPGSMDARKSTTNQQAQLGSSVGLTFAGTGSSYLPGNSKGPAYGPLGSSSVAVMAAASYAQAAAKLPVKSAEQKPAKA